MCLPRETRRTCIMSCMTWRMQVLVLLHSICQPTLARPVDKVGRHFPRAYGMKVSCGRSGQGKMAEVNLHHMCCCKCTLAQGCYRWWHDQVLRKLAESTKSMRVWQMRSPNVTRSSRLGLEKLDNLCRTAQHRTEHQSCSQKVTGQ